MPQSLARIYIHLVFSTKNRRAFLKDPDLRAELHAYLAGICRKRGSHPIVVGGVEDHVHLLFDLGREETIADSVRELKRSSSKWIKERNPDFADFHWQNGYGAFSIGPSHAEAVREYISRQEEHHRRESFQDEVRRILGKYGVTFDEEFVWD